MQLQATYYNHLKPIICVDIIHRFPSKDLFKNLIGENIPFMEGTLTIELSEPGGTY